MTTLMCFYDSQTFNCFDMTTKYQIKIFLLLSCILHSKVVNRQRSMEEIK